MLTRNGRAKRRGRVRVDLLARDAEGTPFLVAEVKTRPARPEDADQLGSYLQFLPPRTSFGLLVDPVKIRVYRWEGKELDEPDLTLDSRSILGAYSDYAGKEILSGPYLTTLTDAWLRDLGYRWKSATPPALAEMSVVGLVPLLEGASTRSEVTVGDYPVS